MSKVFTIAEGLENLGALRTGGQGSVYKGKRQGTIYSAVKLIPTPIYAENEDDKNYRNFRNEVAKLQKVNEIPNPNIVKILSSGLTESGSFPFIEMEFIDGPDLSELLLPPHPKLFTLKEVLKVADQLASALAHCHRLGVKHGDLKSNNVKYNIHTGNYVLLDFGLAIMTEEQRRSSMQNAGAVEFMAPEQYEGKMLLQSDIYSYGIILYELLAGEVPFVLAGNGENGRNAIMLMHLEATVPDVLEKRRSNLPEDWPDAKKAAELQVPGWLLKLVEKCLQKKPTERYADALELYEAISLHQTRVDAAVPVTAPNNAAELEWALKLQLIKNQLQDRLISEMILLYDARPPEALADENKAYYLHEQVTLHHNHLNVLLSANGKGDKVQDSDIRTAVDKLQAPESFAHPAKIVLSKPVLYILLAALGVLLFSTILLWQVYRHNPTALKLMNLVLTIIRSIFAAKK
ncbi:serine/threonine protein kinase [Mucilaginibacter psychrotolerans]|uniref:Serine/threonine protein kinase n=1 Tax=Mucilaginibacter psychrotolerans TaxID=1524096 RepID=A0A4Y8SKX3_9SPHI|nr:serine/threonine-protein kinase [Mucilaginibacter psychrotolerans]TFF39301.1 serine/threonine protein kinase [Mucilaginibacter psychrotolerans]